MRKKILIVDDHADLRQLVVLTLDDPNHEIIEACNADDALDMIMKDQPDLLVLDVMMPGKLNGLQLCEQIKNDPGLHSIKVILLTARGQQSDVSEGTRVKSDAYLVKPFSPMALLQKVQELLKAEP